MSFLSNTSRAENGPNLLVGLAFVLACGIGFLFLGIQEAILFALPTWHPWRFGPLTAESMVAWWVTFFVALWQLPTALNSWLNYGGRLRAREVWEHMATGVVVAERDFAVRYANPAAVRLLGLGALPAGLATAKLDGALPPPAKELLRRHLAAAAASPEHYGQQDLDGPAPFYVTVGRLPDGWVVELRDISERVRALAAAEAARRKAEAALAQADAAERIKAEFIAVMSHEVRTPLNAVIGFSDLLRDTRLDDNQREYLLTIQTASQQLLTVFNDILDYARLEHREIVPHPVQFRLDDMVERAAATFRLPAHEKGLSLTVELAPEARGLWWGDSGRIRQILLALLSNAVKFTERGGVTLRVTAPAEAGDHVCLEVSDTGPGMSAEVQARLFRPFEQGDSGSARRHGGLGLGLALAQRLATIVGGRLSVRSVPGEGSTFTLSVPLELRSRSGSTGLPRPAEAPPDALPAALVVDDDGAISLILARNLEAMGYKVTRADSGELALDYFRLQDYDLVTLDICMPELDGWTVHRQLREILREHPEKTVPQVLGITAIDPARAKHELLEAGFDGYLAKPFRREQLARTIAQLGLPVRQRRAA